MFARGPAYRQRNDAEVVAQSAYFMRQLGFSSLFQMLAELGFGSCALAVVQPWQGLGLGCIPVRL